MTRFTLIGLCLALFVACAGNKNSNSEENNGGNPDFVIGADISWASEMEHDGRSFQFASGDEGELVDILSYMGVTAIRLRVFVDPVGGWCGKDDVVKAACKAKDAGMDIMIDFHYSDYFADPHRQTVPAAWKGLGLADMCSKVSEHTADVLSAIKKAGVDVKWVQVGNETRCGMLWDTGRLWNEKGDIPEGWRHYAKLSNAGYDAVKSVYPETTVIIHIDNSWLDNGIDPWWYDSWWFEKFIAAGGRLDMIGLSHYPMTYEGMDWAQVNQLALNKIKLLSETYGYKVMVCEVGVQQHQPSVGAECLAAFMKAAKELESCAGVFYWEPEVDGVWKPAIYDSLGWGAYGMGAFDSAGKPTAIMDAFVK